MHKKTGFCLIDMHKICQIICFLFSDRRTELIPHYPYSEIFCANPILSP